MVFWLIGALITLLFVTIWHELGHLLAAKLVGIPVKYLSVGFGPVLCRRSLTHDTDLVLRAVPLGMSVAVPGRREANGQLRRPLRADILMAAAGPAASLLLTLLLLVALLFGLVHPTLTDWVIGAALLSAFLALLNLVPIPGLDGGHLMVLTAARLGWQLPPQQEVRLHRQGLNALVALSLVPLLIQLWWMW